MMGLYLVITGFSLGRIGFFYFNSFFFTGPSLPWQQFVWFVCLFCFSILRTEFLSGTDDAIRILYSLRSLFCFSFISFFLFSFFLVGSSVFGPPF